MNSWISYIFCGALALTLSLVTTGCRFGNRIQEKPPVKDGLTGFYETLPTEANVFASYIPEGGDAFQDKTFPLELEQLPAAFAEDLMSVMRNPVIFQLKKQSTDTGYLFSPYDSSESPPFFKLTYDSALNLELTAVGNETPLSDTCTDIDFRYVGKGRINVPATGAYQKNFDDVPVTISGRVELSIESGHLFEGECASALQSLSDCLKNSSACAKSSDYARAQNIFGFYLEKELLTLDDIPYVSLLGVQVNYE